MTWLSNIGAFYAHVKAARYGVHLDFLHGPPSMATPSPQVAEHGPAQIIAPPCQLDPMIKTGPDLSARALIYHNRNPKAAAVYLEKHQHLHSLMMAIKGGCFDRHS